MLPRARLFSAAGPAPRAPGCGKGEGFTGEYHRVFAVLLRPKVPSARYVELFDFLCERRVNSIL